MTDTYGLKPGNPGFNRGVYDYGREGVSWFLMCSIIAVSTTKAFVIFGLSFLLRRNEKLFCGVIYIRADLDFHIFKYPQFCSAGIGSRRA